MCSITYKLQEPLRWSSVPTSIMSTTRVRWGLTTCDVQEKVRRGLWRCSRQHPDQPQFHLGSVKTFPESPRTEPGPSTWLSQRPSITTVSQHAQLKARGFGSSPPLSQSLCPPSYWALFVLYLLTLLQSLPRQPGTVLPCSEKTISPLLLDYRKTIISITILDHLTMFHTLTY